MIAIISELTRGLCIGAGAILPGISGASLAAAFGVFEEFTLLASHPCKEAFPFFRRRWRLCLGIGTGFILCTYLLSTLFRAHESALILIIAGFIAGTIPGLFVRAKKLGLGAREIISFCIAAGILLATALLPTLSAESNQASNITIGSTTLLDLLGENRMGLVGWFFSGGIVAAGSLLPGFSASVFLINLGMYGPLLDGIKTPDPLSFACFGLGALVSIALFSRLIHWLYQRFRSIVSFAVLGLTFGSLVLLIPANIGMLGSPVSPVVFILVCVACATSFYLDRAL